MPSRTTSEQINWVAGMKGLHDSVIPGSNPKLTPDLRNVKVRYGRVFGRGGMKKYLAISAVAANPPIIDLLNYPRSGSATNELLRMTLTKLEKLNTGTSVWDDVTGVAFSNLNTTRPQWTIIDDTLVFTNEGIDRPRKYTGSGNSAEIASGAAPYAKVIADAEGFLILGNISDDGTFTDITDGQRTLRYSDDWDTTWTACPGDARAVGDIILHLTPGAVTGALVLGRELLAYKEDGIERLVWTPGAVVWKQFLMPTPIGTTAPKTIKLVLEKFHMMLGTDGLIYRITQAAATPISDEVLANTLHTSSVRDLGRYKFSRSLVDSEEGVYILLYDRTGLTQQFLNSYVMLSYLTGEVTKGRLGLQVVAAEGYRPTKSSREVALLSTNTLIEEFDAQAVDDDGNRISRYWTTGWQKLGGGEEGWFTGALVLMKQSKRGRIRISVAIDFDQTFEFPQQSALNTGDPANENVEVVYSPPAVKGEWFNVKIELFHPTTTTETEVLRVGFMGVPLSRTVLNTNVLQSSGVS